MEKEKFNIKESLKKLKEIVDWFDNQEEMDIEAGLEKVKDAFEIIKNSKKKLKEIENEFEKIKKEVILPEENIDDK